MADNRDRISAGSTKTGSSRKDAEFFTVGPPLHAVRAGYIRRKADDFLYESIIAGHDAHVLAPARSGKTSLIAATSARLQNNGYNVATLDLAQIGERDGGSDAGRWYYSIAYRLLRQARIKFDLQSWWQDKSFLSNRQRLVEFYSEAILANKKDSIVVFIDEIQCIENLPFAQDLLASIRAAHNSIATEPEFSRLIFVLCGECDPQILVTNEVYSPFDTMRAVVLEDFSRQDIDVFSTELNLSPADSCVALDRINYWTAGQPYLTQKLARAVARENLSDDIEGQVDRIAEHQLGGRSALHNEPHMGHIHRRIVEDRKGFEAMLNLFGRMQKGIEVLFEPESREQRQLMAIGLLIRNREGLLKPRNRLYASVFTARWANENLPSRWQGPAIAAAILAVLVAVPFWYTQLLPKPYMRVLISETLPLDTVNEAYVNYRSFPGHANTADRLFADLLTNRARGATDIEVLSQIRVLADTVPDRDRFADELTASYWDRSLGRALRLESRDDALLASLQSLIVSTPKRRRVAASLIGSDYPQLIETIARAGSERLMFNPENQLLTMVDGARMTQWTIISQRLQSRAPWTISALEITPLVRRVVVDRTGTVSRISLTVNVGHSRLDDLRVRLISPSGRAVAIEFEQTSSSENNEIRFNGGALAAFMGEALSGTWTLSLRDESTGTAGHLIGWNLQLNSQVIVENFERGLDIPEPIEKLSDDIWFGNDGRYAIARAQQSDSARLWDLAHAQPARTVAVPASENVLGLSAGAKYLVTIAQDTVNLWNTITGRRESTLNIGPGSRAQLTGDKQSLLVSRSGEGETAYELWNLESAARVANLTVGGSPALVSFDRAGRHLAIADYDRAVRIWDFPNGELLGQIDLHAQASFIALSPDGDSLGVVHGNHGVTLWQTGNTLRPLLMESSVQNWQIDFSASGRLFVAGGGGQGFQLYRSSNGAVVGPLLGSGFSSAPEKLLAFSGDEKTLVIADVTGLARFWRVANFPLAIAASDAADEQSAHSPWAVSGESVAAIAPGGRRLAIGDDEGHVHIVSVGTDNERLSDAGDDLSFLGHRSKVVGLTFSPDGSLVASASDDGSIRIWDAVSGLPRPYHASASSSRIERLNFSKSGRRLAVLGGQSMWILDIETGTVIADIDLGEVHSDIAFVTEDQLYLGGESGVLRSLTADRLGSWNLRTVWAGTSPLRRIQLSATKQLLLLSDADNVARIFDIENGSIGSRTLPLTGPIDDILFSPGESRVLLRNPHWIHRAEVSPGGLIWQSAIRSPQALNRSRMAFLDIVDGKPMASPGNRILMLTRDAGFIELADLNFAGSAGPMLFGARDELLAQWRRKLGRAASQ